MGEKNYKFKYGVGDVIKKTIQWAGKTYENPTIYGYGEFVHKESGKVFPWYQFVDAEAQPQPAKSCWVRAEVVESPDVGILIDPDPPPTCPHPPC